MGTTAPTTSRPGTGAFEIADHKWTVNKRQRVDPAWFACWYDHAGRLIRRNVGLVRDLGGWQADGSPPPAVREAARLAAEKYIEDHARLLALKEAASEEEVDELRQRASFPRAVVAFHIDRLCERISCDSGDEGRAGRPGLQLFAERACISSREAHRILEDDERISVGLDTVDKICREFDMLLDDFIEDAIEWADREGQWKNRAGTKDAWPFGYVQNKVVDDDGII